MCNVGFFDHEGFAVEKEFHKVANALSHEYCFAHTYSQQVQLNYTYSK